MSELTACHYVATEHEALKPRLAELRKDASKLAGSYGSLESRVENLLTQYDDYVRTHAR